LRRGSELREVVWGISAMCRELHERALTRAGQEPIP
jgi:hypothetical protein